MKIGDLVRFKNEQDGGPVHRIVSVMSDGMVEIHDFVGYFAAHLFVAAEDVGGIPPNLKMEAMKESSLHDAASAIMNRHVGEMGICKDGSSEWIVQDMSTEYGDSTLHELTVEALSFARGLGSNPSQTSNKE